MSLSVNGVALYNCDKDNSALEKLTTLDDDSLHQSENETVREVSLTLLERLVDDDHFGDKGSKTPRYGASKNARIHSFSDDAKDSHHEVPDSTTIDVLEELREVTNFEENTETVAEWYLKEKNSLTALLIIFSYELNGESYVMVVKTPYVENAFQVDTTDILSEVDQIIQQQADKAFIYPSRDQNDSINTNQAKLYHGRSGPPAKYWYNFIQLKESSHDDEALFQLASEGVDELTEIDDLSSLYEIDDKVSNEKVPDGQVKITIDDDIELRLQASRLGTDEVFFAEEGNSKFLILRGNKIDIEVTQGDRSEDPFPNVDSFETLSEALTQYIN